LHICRTISLIERNDDKVVEYANQIPYKSC
jgi:hypothetical protein